MAVLGSLKPPEALDKVLGTGCGQRSDGTSRG